MSPEEREALGDWWDSEWPRDGSHTLDVLAAVVDQIAEARVRAALEAAQRVIAGEDTVEWARRATRSHISLPHAMDAIDGLIEDLADAATPPRSSTRK